LSQMFRSFEANSWAIHRKGSEDLAKASTPPAVDQSNLGRGAPKAHGINRASCGVIPQIYWSDNITITVNE